MTVFVHKRVEYEPEVAVNVLEFCPKRGTFSGKLSTKLLFDLAALAFQV